MLIELVLSCILGHSDPASGLAEFKELSLLSLSMSNWIPFGAPFLLKFKGGMWCWKLLLLLVVVSLGDVSLVP